LNYKNWYAVAVQTNKEQTCVAQLLSRKSVLFDTYLLDVVILKRKEIKMQKNGKRTVKETKLMPGYIMVQVDKQVIENDDGTVTKEFPAATFDLITQTSGIQGFVNLNRKSPIPMKDKQVKKMFDMCDDAHLEVINIQGDKILGQLTMFGRTIPAEFTKTQVYKNETTRS